MNIPMGQRDWEIWTTQKRIDSLEETWSDSKEGRFRLLRNIVPNYEIVLDIGCGTGYYYPFLTEKGATYIGMDSSTLMIERAKQEFPEADFRIGDIYNIGIKDSSIDMVMAMDVFSNSPHFDASFKEVCRVAKNYVLFSHNISIGRNASEEFWYRGSWGEIINVFSMKGIFENVSKRGGKLVRNIPRKEKGSWMGLEFERRVFLMELEKW